MSVYVCTFKFLSVSRVIDCVCMFVGFCICECLFGIALVSILTNFCIFCFLVGFDSVSADSVFRFASGGFHTAVILWLSNPKACAAWLFIQFSKQVRLNKP